MEQVQTQTQCSEFHLTLNEFRSQEKYTDVNIQCEDKIFKSHRLVLAAASKYFDAMFSNNWSENNKTDIPLPAIDATTFEEVLNFVYKGDIVITSDNVFSLLRASAFLQLRYIEKLCTKYIEENTPIEDALEIFLFACKTKNNSLRQTLSRYIADRLCYFWKNDAFLELEFEDLNIILSQSLPFRNEDIIVKAVHRWMNYFSKGKVHCIPKLLEIINFEKISAQCSKFLFGEIMSKCVTLNERNDNNVESTVSADALDKPIVPNFETRSDRSSIHVYIETDSTTNVFSSQKCSRWDNWSFSCRTERTATYMRCIELNNYLYCLDYSDGCNASRPLQTFNSYSSISMFPNTRTHLSSPPRVLSEFQMCGLQNTIYVSYNIDLHSGGIHAYNCELDKWLPVSNMEENPLNTRMTADRDRGLLYVIATGSGFAFFDDEKYLPFMEVYDNRTSQWQNLPSPNGRGLDALCCFHEGKIYHIHGSFYENKSFFEVYDPVAGKWEKLLPMNEIRTIHKLLSYENQLWAVGSFKTPGNTNVIVDAYNPSIQHWSLMEKGTCICQNSELFVHDAVVFKSFEI